MFKKSRNRIELRTLIPIFGIVFLLVLFGSYAWWFKHDRYYRNIKKEILAKTELIDGVGESGGESIYGVSPSERWLVYCRKATQDETFKFTIVVRDLDSGSRKAVHSDNRRELYSIRGALYRGCWNEDCLYLGDAGRGKVHILDLQTADIRIVKKNETGTNCADANRYRNHNPYTFRDFGDGPFTGGADIIKKETEEVLLTFPARLGLWTVRPSWPSPDDRFVIISATRRNFFECLLLLVPMLGGSDVFERKFLYLFDTQNDKLYKLDKAKDFEAPLWQLDSKTFYYVRSSRNSEIVVVKIKD